MTNLNPITTRVLTSIANTAEQAGGSFIVQLPDNRYITVIVIHEDPQPPAQTPQRCNTPGTNGHCDLPEGHDQPHQRKGWPLNPDGDDDQ